MFPRTVKCEDCGKIASVCGYGQIAYRWPETTNMGHESTIPTIDRVRLTIDCPGCGVKSQEFFPGAPSPAAQSSATSRPSRLATGRSREVRFQRMGPAKRAF